jgi:uncharacterized delta-60 repeat protein
VSCAVEREFGGRTLARRALPLKVATTIVALLLGIPASASAADSMVVQPDGKILLSGARGSSFGNLGFRNRGILARVNPDGTPDTTFGKAGGLVDFRPGSPFGLVAVQTDGQIVAAAEGKQGGGFVLRAFQPDGEPSLDFGESGVAIGPAIEPGLDPAPSAILSRSDDRLVVGGTVSAYTIKAPRRAIGAAQLFNQDGSFVETGRIDSSRMPEAFRNTSLAGLLLQPDGSLIAVGESEKYEDRNILLGRFLPGGGASYDSSFAAGAGLTLVNPFPKSWQAPPTRANAVVAGTSGLIAVGTAQNRPLLVGFDEKGILDTSFGEGGFVNPSLEGSLFAEATAAAVEMGGKIVIAGGTLDQCGGSARGCWDLFVGRLNPNGSVDTSFGVGGFSHLALPIKKPLVGIAEDEKPGPVDVAIVGDGKVLASVAEGRTLEVARLNADGSLDASFGSVGIASAAPCLGNVVELRRAGCLSTGQVSLWGVGLRDRRPKLRFRVRPSEQLDPLRNFRLDLPRALTTRARFAGRIRVVDQEGNSLTPTVRQRLIAVNKLGKADSVSLTLPRGVLKRAKRIAGGHKLVFRVQVWFQDGSKQTIVLRRAG